VIQSLEFRFKKEVYVGDRITYRVAVSRLSAAVGAVRLLLSVKRDDGEVVLEGTAQCVFPPKS
jgi:acyl dehydratase